MGLARRCLASSSPSGTSCGRRGSSTPGCCRSRTSSRPLPRPTLTGLCARHGGRPLLATLGQLTPACLECLTVCSTCTCSTVSRKTSPHSLPPTSSTLLVSLSPLAFLRRCFSHPLPPTGWATTPTATKESFRPMLSSRKCFTTPSLTSPWATPTSRDDAKYILYRFRHMKTCIRDRQIKVGALMHFK